MFGSLVAVGYFQLKRREEELTKEVTREIQDYKMRVTETKESCSFRQKYVLTKLKGILDGYENRVNKSILAAKDSPGPSSDVHA